MISIGNVTKGQMGSYYEQDDYYFKQDENGINVYGNNSHAKTFEGFSVAEKRTAFGKLADGREVKTKDITFSPPKSISLMFASGDEKQKNIALEAHRSAVEKTMKYVEQNLFNVRKKEHGQSKEYHGDGLVALGFEHSINRNMDPQLHTHVLIANNGYTKGDEQSRSVSFKDIFSSQHKLDLFYKSYIRADLEKNGYKTRKTQDGFELAIVNDEQIRIFSTRKAQVDKNLEEMGLTRKTATAEQRQQATLKNRASKKNANNHDLSTIWKSEFIKHKIEITQSKDIPDEKNREKKVFNTVHQGYIDYISRDGISTKHQAVSNILKFAETENSLDEKVPLITLDDVEKHLSQIMKIEKMVRLPGQKEDSGDVKEKFVSEKFLIADIENQQYLNQGKGIYKGKAIANIEHQIDMNAKTLFDFKFEGEQRTAAIGVLKSEDFLVGIQGDPGTGKTTLLKAVVSVQGAEHMIAVAKAGAAAQKLGDETGIEARTIDRFILDFKRRAEVLEEGSNGPRERKILEDTEYIENLTRSDRINPALIVVDESSMNGDFDLNHLCKIAEKTGSKIVLAGDIQQLPGVAAGESFKKMQEQGMETFKLKEIRRQRGKVELEAVQAITLRKKVQESVDILQQNPDIIKEEKKDKERLDQIKQDYITQVSNGNLNPLLITSTNKDKDELNKNIREELKTIGKLDKIGETHATIRNRNKLETEICAGDRIVFLRNDNDKIIITSSEEKILNGNQGIIETIKNGKIHACLVDDEGRKTEHTATFDVAEYNHLDHAYALSTYKSQGQSVERNVMYHTPATSPLLSTNEFLVGISRNKEKLTIYTDDIQKMTIKASKWVNKNDALSSYQQGLSISSGKSERLQCAMDAVHEKLKRDSDVSEERQELVKKYGLFSKATKKECTRVNDLWESSRQKFHEDLFKIKDIDKSVTETQIEHYLSNDLNKWANTRKKAIQTFEQDKSRYRLTNHYKQLKANDDELCKKILALEGNKVADQKSEAVYDQVNERMDTVRSRKLFPIPVQEVQQFKPIKRMSLLASPEKQKEQEEQEKKDRIEKALQQRKPRSVFELKKISFPNIISNQNIDTARKKETERIEKIKEKQLVLVEKQKEVEAIKYQIYVQELRLRNIDDDQIIKESFSQLESFKYYNIEDNLKTTKKERNEIVHKQNKLGYKLERYSESDKKDSFLNKTFNKDHKEYLKIKKSFNLLGKNMEDIDNDLTRMTKSKDIYDDRILIAKQDSIQHEEQCVNDLKNKLDKVSADVLELEKDIKMASLSIEGQKDNKKDNDFVGIGASADDVEKKDEGQDDFKDIGISSSYVEDDDDEEEEDLGMSM